MSDTENAGWDDDTGQDWGSGAGGGAADDDGGWGATGDGDACDADGWGEAEDDSGQAGADDQEDDLPLNVQLENAYYEADDDRLERKPAAALEKFQKVLDLGAKHIDKLADERESIGFVFKAARAIISLHYAAGNLDKMTKAYQTLLSYVPKVTRNEALDAVMNVLHEVSDNKDKAFVTQVYSDTISTLKSLPDQERLLFRVNMKYCERCFAMQEYKEAHEKLEELLRSCRHPDGRDELSKGAELLEIYALESRISSATKDSVKLQALYEKTKNLNAAVKDPRSLSVIRECWGEMFAEQGDWSRAFQEFFSAFSAYQEIGNAIKAKQCLKYVVVANMLSGGSSNPFDSREAKAFQNDKEIEAIGLLRSAYEKCEVSKFNSLLQQIISSDAFIAKHIGSMVRDFQARAILQLIKAYRRVRLDYLAEVLQVEVSKVENLLVPLILDGLIVGKIDQVRGLLDTTQSVGGGQKYLALERWSNALTQLRHSLPQPGTHSR
jgi:COP9 signalosome complex subunit 2